MRRVYAPPQSSGSPFISMGLAVVLASLIFLVLPLTEYFSASKKEKELPPRTVDVFLPPPPPPPPPPPAPPQPREQRLATPALEPERPPQPLTLRQLDLTLNPGTGDALRGDFTMNFSGTPDAIAELKIFELSEVDQAPQALHRPQPVYPYQLERARVSGSATVRFIVDETGQARDARIESSTHREFEKPALEAVRKSKFTPATKNGVPVPTWVIAPYRFEAPR